ncbi:MAG: tRNA pseudouridine(55) synthase TruB [Oligosphaeraceae bacterium]
MNRKNANHVDGILLVDKPADWTSFDVVNLIRRQFHLDKTGHCGTLDPFATGLLVVLLGKATRLQDSLMAREKTYSGTLRLGEETETEDLTGETVRTLPLPPDLTLEALQRQADTFLGDILQRPPMHSAIKIHGQPLYKLARKGQEVERPPRPVHIRSFQLRNLRGADVDFLVECSKGTYIRTLGADLGRKTGCGGHLRALRRLRSGDHKVEDAFPVDLIRTWDLEALQAHREPLP